MIHTLPNISRNKGNQTMKFNLLTKYNIRNIFLEKPYRKCGGKTSSRLISKIKIEHASRSIHNSLKFYIICFLLHIQVEGYQKILKLKCEHLLLP